MTNTVLFGRIRVIKFTALLIKPLHLLTRLLSAAAVSPLVMYYSPVLVPSAISQNDPFYDPI